MAEWSAKSLSTVIHRGFPPFILNWNSDGHEMSASADASRSDFEWHFSLYHLKSSAGID